MENVTIVCATRETEQSFFKTSALGKTLDTAYKAYGIRKLIFYKNSRGLSECYNIAISQAPEDETLVFVHDDIFIPDFFWMKSLFVSLSRFDLVGVAGNRRRVSNQPGWAFIRFDEKHCKFDWDSNENLSGLVGHGNNFPCPISVYGRPEERCLLLDGVFLAAKKKTFLNNQIKFDEQFKFHFYDMDICRQFERAGLTLGTTPISIIHESGGKFGSPQWLDAYAAYIKKWKE